MSLSTPTSKATTSDQIAVGFAQVEVQQDVYVSESKGTSTGTLVSQKQAYVGSSDDSPRTFRPSPLSTPTQGHTYPGIL